MSAIVSGKPLTKLAGSGLFLVVWKSLQCNIAGDECEAWKNQCREIITIAPWTNWKLDSYLSEILHVVFLLNLD